MSPKGKTKEQFTKDVIKELRRIGLLPPEKESSEKKEKQSTPHTGADETFNVEKIK